MPKTLNEWLLVVSFLAAAALWGTRMLVWLVRIHDKLQQLVSDHQTIATRVEQHEAGIERNGQSIKKINQELGLV